VVASERIKDDQGQTNSGKTDKKLTPGKQPRYKCNWNNQKADPIISRIRYHIQNEGKQHRQSNYAKTHCI